MSRYLSWTNVASVWCIVLLLGSLYLGEYSKEKRLMIAGLLMFLTACNISDIICRYQVLRGKDR